MYLYYATSLYLLESLRNAVFFNLILARKNGPGNIKFRKKILRKESQQSLTTKKT